MTDTLKSLIPDNEAERLTALYQLDVLDRPLADELDSIVRLARVVSRAGVAVVNLIDRDRQWQPCAIGMKAGEVAREDAMCSVTVAHGAFIHVRDASIDPRFVNNPYVTGRYGDVRMYASAPLFSEGQIIGTLCVVDESAYELNADEIKALEDLAAQVVTVFELRRQASLMGRANRDLEAFAGMLTHDLRNPLASAIGFAEMLKEQIPDNEENAFEHGMADRLTRSLGRIEQLITDTLTYSRNTQGTQFLTAVNVSESVQMVLENLHRLIEETDAQIVTGKLPFVFGDALQISQLLQNLVANAINYSNKETPEVYVGAEIVGRGFRIVVEDNGPGVPEAMADDIFEPFKRGESEVSGTGLGLSTCRRIVERHNGQLTVGRSEKLGGARFVIDLPDQALDPDQPRHYK